MITKMKLITDERYSKTVDFDQCDHDSPIFYSFYSTSNEYADNIDNFAQVSKHNCKIYDSAMQSRIEFTGLNIRSCIDMHQSYLYTISDSRTQPYSVTDLTKENGHEIQKMFRYSPPGFYVLDTQRLFEGKLEQYRLTSAVGGVCNLINADKFSNRLSFIQDYNKIAVIPLPHLNLINFVGMGQKHEYIVWRDKNGFFSALDYRSNLLTWSIFTGKLLYSEPQRMEDDAHEN